MDIVYAVLLWLTPWGATTGAFEMIPDGQTACEEYLADIVDAAEEQDLNMVGKCTRDLDEVGRIITEFITSGELDGNRLPQ